MVFMKKIVFTTAVGEKPDYFARSVRDDSLRYSLPTPSFGLRFLKENIPEINILEYPDWITFEDTLKKGIDILGISFYMTDIPIVIKMVEMARKHGVKQIWGGNYGVLNDEVQQYFDRIFVCYAEREIAKELNHDLVEIKHPAIITSFGLNKTPFKISHAFLFTTRGCQFKCSFCQTPSFTNGIDYLSLNSIDSILKNYKENKVKSVFIMDDNFFANKKFSDEVIDLIQKHKLNWGVCTRAENLHNRVQEFKERGMFMCITGIETLKQENLDKIMKGTTVDLILDTIKELSNNNIYIHGTYLIGFETDTKESIKKDMDFIAKLAVQSMQICVLTPFPHTSLWDDIEKKYGIFEKDYSKFDAYHLVWNHPNIKPEEMDEILKYARSKCYPPTKIINGFMTVVKRGMFWKFISPF